MTAGRVPDEWVEAAAKESYEFMADGRRKWDDLDDSAQLRQDYIEDAQVHLAAVMPLVAAERDELRAELNVAQRTIDRLTRDIDALQQRVSTAREDGKQELAQYLLRVADEARRGAR